MVAVIEWELEFFRFKFNVPLLHCKYYINIIGYMLVILYRSNKKMDNRTPLYVFGYSNNVITFSHLLYNDPQKYIS